VLGHGEVILAGSDHALSLLDEKYFEAKKTRKREEKIFSSFWVTNSHT
jgi:hypothetical protein